MLTKNNKDFKKLLKIIREIPLFSILSDAQLINEIRIEPQVSYTNKTYKVSINKISYLLKTPRANTNTQISRYHEHFNNQTAYEMGLAPQVIWHNYAGFSLIEYIESSRILVASDLKKASIVEKLTESLIKLQHSNINFKGSLHKPTSIRRPLEIYYKRCSIQQQKKLQTVYKKALLALDIIENFDLSAVPAHIDLTLDNILIENNRDEKLWLIDWEYSAMASPLWDIAIICNSADFDDIQGQNFMLSVISNSGEKETQLLTNYRQLLFGLSSCWHGAFNKDKEKPLNESTDE